LKAEQHANRHEKVCKKRAICSRLDLIQIAGRRPVIASAWSATGIGGTTGEMVVNHNLQPKFVLV
jgi:hypothetical protein